MASVTSRHSNPRSVASRMLVCTHTCRVKQSGDFQIDRGEFQPQLLAAARLLPEPSLPLLLLRCAALVSHKCVAPELEGEQMQEHTSVEILLRYTVKQTDRKSPRW